jgi:hypothetical protein
MKKHLAPIGMIAGGVVMLIASLQPQPAIAGRHDRSASYKVQQTEVIKNSYPVPATAAREIEVDNVFGSVEVVGTTGDQVELVPRMRRKRSRSTSSRTATSCAST